MPLWASVSSFIKWGGVGLELRSTPAPSLIVALFLQLISYVNYGKAIIIYIYIKFYIYIKLCLKYKMGAGLLLYVSHRSVVTIQQEEALGKLNDSCSIKNVIFPFTVAEPHCWKGPLVD